MTQHAETRPQFLQHLFAATIIAVSLLCCFHKLVLHPTDVLVGPQSGGENDLTNYYIPSRTFLRESLTQDNQINHWNPWLSYGTAYIGNAQSAACYPLNWLTVLFNPTWFLSWLQLFHHWWAGLGVYFLCRHQKLSFGASLFGGISLACAPFLIAQGAEGHYAQIAASSWIPWAFLAFHLFVEHRSKRGHIAVAVCLAMSFLCSHPQETYYLVLILSCLAFYESCKEFWSENRQVAKQLLSGWVIIGVTTIGLVAIDLVPIYFNSRTTPRGMSAVSAELMGWAAYDVQHFWQLVAPFSVDRPETWQRGTPPFWEKIGYFGVITLCLAVTGAICSFKDRWVGRISLIALLTVLVAMGTNGFLFPIILKIVPGMSWFRLPSRLFFVTAFCLAYLAANGVERLKPSSDSKLNRLPVFLLLILLGISAGLAFFQFKSTTDVINLRTVLTQTLTGISILAFLLCSILLINQQRFSRLIVALLSILVVLELSLFSTQITDTAVVAGFGTRHSELTEEIDSLRESGKLKRVLTVQELISDQDAIHQRIPKTRGYDPASSIFFLTLINSFSENEQRPVDPTGFSQVKLSEASQKVLDMSGVSHVVQVQRKGFSEPPASWNQLWQGTTQKRVQRREDDEVPEFRVELVENPNAFPEAFIVGHALTPKSGEKLPEILSVVDFKKSVILSHEVLPEGNRSQYQAAKIVFDQNDAMHIEAELDAPGYLVVSDLWFPGWSATVNEKRLPVLRGNFSFRVVPLPAGEHLVKFTFQPPGFQVGMIVTIMTLIGCAALLVTSPKAVETSPESTAKHNS